MFGKKLSTSFSEELSNCRLAPKSKAFVEPSVKRLDVNWIAVLVPCEDGTELETIGSAFKITTSVLDAHASAAPAKDLFQLCFVFGNAASCFAGMSGG